jgi:cell division transport system ATP-binding protein
MAVLERITAGGTTVVMATHEADIVDQMKRRVIELVGGQIVRDERHGGYGFTAAIPIAQPLERDEPVSAATPVFAGAAAPANAAPANAVPTNAVPTGAAPMTRPNAPTSVPTAPVSVPQQAPQQTAPHHAAQPPAAGQPAHDPRPAHQPQHSQSEQPAAYPAPVQFATAPVPPAPASEDLPEHLNVTANLDLSGLREESDRDGDQNVGPTK